MKKLSARGQKWLKGCHVFFAGLWVGGAVALTLMNFLLKAADGMELYGINRSLKFVDDLIIIPGAMGSLLTALIYALFTNWGWFKHRWITLKWIINVGGVIFGTFWLGPWTNSLVPLAKARGLAALADPAYAQTRTLLLSLGTIQACTIVLAVFISVLKPWKRSKANRA